MGENKLIFLLFYSSSPSCKTVIAVQAFRCHINYYTRGWLEPSLSLKYHERNRGLQNANWTLQMHWQGMVDMFQRVPVGVNRTHASFLNALAALKKEKGKRERGRERKVGGGWVLECWPDFECLSQLREITLFIAHPSLSTPHASCAHTKLAQAKSFKQSWLKAMCHYLVLRKRPN